MICAPTGAGKTNVAMLTVLHEVGKHLMSGIIQKEDFKIVYLAPLKALAREVVRKFSTRLNPLGLAVAELTGDTNLTKSQMLQTQILVATPEKYDVMTRKNQDGSLMSKVKLLIIDEVHLLHEDRGPVIEVLVSRTRRLIETSQKLCRIIGLSATLPNYADLCVFLGVHIQTGLFHFGPEYRPVPLTQTYIGVRKLGSTAKEKKCHELYLL